MGFKVFIVALWLAVPVTLGLLLQADRQQYAEEGAAQHALCLQRIQLLQHHATGFSAQAAKLDAIDDEQHLRNWRQLWGSLQRDYGHDLPPLDAQQLSHFPATRTVLDTQADAVQGLQTTVEGVARNREYFMRGAGAMDQLAHDIDYLNWQAQRYRLYGAEGVYLILQDQLAQAEARFQHQQQEQQRLSTAISSGMGQALRQGADIQAALNEAGTQLAQDEKLTYAEAIRQRWAAFDLKQALTDFLAQLALKQTNRVHS